MILNSDYDTTKLLVEPISLYDLLVTEKLPIIVIEAVLDGFKLRAYEAPRLADRYWYLTTTRGMRYRTRANGEAPQRWSKSEWVDIPLTSTCQYVSGAIRISCL